MAENEAKLRKHVTPSIAWALSLGTTIGWGSLIVTSNTYLSQAGPAGSVAGLLIGTCVMLIMCWNYHYMMNCFPDAGGAYAFAKESFGYDLGFLTAWFLALTYLAVLWANATSLPLFARYFIGNMFRFGYLYTIFGYDVYIGETLLTIAGIVLISLLCMKKGHLALRLLVGMAAVLAAGITVCFAGAMAGHDFSFAPAFIPDRNALSQIIRITCISSWAFIGFENISHMTEEFSFPRKRSFRLLALAVAAGSLLYVMLLLLSVSAHPPQYDSWLSYIRDLGNLSGIEGLPAFYAARHYLGQPGVWILMLVLLCLVLTSLIGNITALSRLFYALARDRVLPGSFEKTGRDGVPERAIMLIAGISCIVPLLGRTAIGWIVDVTTLGATMTYGFVCISTFRTALVRNDRPEKVTGMAGLVIMILFGLYLLLPNLFTSNTMETETFFLFVAWSVLGFIYFHRLLRGDRDGHFGKSIVVWIFLLSMVLFISLVWMSQSTLNATTRAVDHIRQHYIGDASQLYDEVVSRELAGIRSVSRRSILAVIAMFGISLGTLLSNFALMRKRVKESEEALVNMRVKVHTDPLTGVKSKQAYAEREKQINEEITAQKAGPFAVVVCDVNGLKRINDTYGHKAGDAYIREASHVICEIFQHSPVFRIGGDEFLVILTDRDYEMRRERMQRLHDQSVANIGTDHVVIAGGVSGYRSGEDTTFHDVFERADERMYREKKQLKEM